MYTSPAIKVENTSINGYYYCLHSTRRNLIYRGFKRFIQGLMACDRTRS